MAQKKVKGGIKKSAKKTKKIKGAGELKAKVNLVRKNGNPVSRKEIEDKFGKLEINL